MWFVESEKNFYVDEQAAFIVKSAKDKERKKPQQRAYKKANAIVRLRSSSQMSSSYDCQQKDQIAIFSSTGKAVQFRKQRVDDPSNPQGSRSADLFFLETHCQAYAQRHPLKLQ
mgnify:CR=1 FL=1